jgi:hypothetical protein
VRPAKAIAEVGTERSLGVLLVAHDDVVQAVSAESADHSFTKGVRLSPPAVGRMGDETADAR